MTMGPNTLPGGQAACRTCRAGYTDPDMQCILCATCARPVYISLPSQLFCSEWCRQWWKNRSGVRRRTNSMRDAAKRGSDRPAETFDPLEIFQRDRWRCQVCGIRTKRTARVPDRQAPTLDHIVPLSKGGEHTRANTRLLCMSCNASKGNRATDDQLRLIG
jgi:5-methylcytosine-specific restriction endonuclease McrA